MRAGVMKNAEAPTMWCPYFSVADCDAAVERAKKLGGKVHVGPHDIPNIGRFAILADPQGATFAMMKPAM